MTKEGGGRKGEGGRRERGELVGGRIEISAQLLVQFDVRLGLDLSHVKLAFPRVVFVSLVFVLLTSKGECFRV